MSDPVDTDALWQWAGKEPTWDDIDRGWTTEALSAIGGLCGEVDRLREANEEAEASRSAAAAYSDQLRAVIENAPHDTTCAITQTGGLLKGDRYVCTCWKADAL